MSETWSGTEKGVHAQTWFAVWSHNFQAAECFSKQAVSKTLKKVTQCGRWWADFHFLQINQSVSIWIVNSNLSVHSAEV